MLCLLPVVISQLPGMEMSARTAFVPVLNLSLAIKQILIDGANLDSLFLVSASTLATTALILALAARLYQREELLIERSGARGFFSGGARRGPQSTPDPEQAIMLMAVLFVVLYYVGSALQAWNLMVGLVLTLAVGMLGPVLLCIRLLKLDFRETLHLRRPPALAMLAATLLGVSSFVWVSALTHLFYDTFLPVPEVFEEMLREAFSTPRDWSGKLLMVAVVAVTPAICEEAIFRGWLLSSLRGRVKPWTAIILTAVIFGVFHLSIYRFLGTASLGLLMGWMVWQTRSIWPAVLYHLLNNACSVLSEDALRALGVDTQAEPLPIWLLALSLATSVAGGLLLLRSHPAEQDDDDPLEDQPHHLGGAV
jgi:sodium transport system permease protein